MEHRKEYRTPLLVYLDVIDIQTQKNLGYLGDISLEGMMLITTQDIPVGQVFDIQIQLPESAALEFSQTQTIDLQIEVVWQKNNLNPELFCLGCHFTQISDADRDLLQRVGQALGFNQATQVHRVN